jgi:hypothetical protein
MMVDSDGLVEDASLALEDGYLVRPRGEPVVGVRPQDQVARVGPESCQPCAC